MRAWGAVLFSLAVLATAARAETAAVPFAGIVPPGADPVTVGPDASLPLAVEAWKARSGARCKPSLRVVKKSRLLVARCGADVVKRYVVNLGFVPEGDKVRQGDGKTPEGRLFVCSKNENSRFHLFLGLSYPDAGDAVRGEASSLVSAAERTRIERAVAKGGCPPWGTALGGAVGIHGSGGFVRAGEMVLVQDWTLGCVAVRDADIEELWDFAPVGTPVDVVP